jgi:hypothetical protein
MQNPASLTVNKVLKNARKVNKINFANKFFLQILTKY